MCLEDPLEAFLDLEAQLGPVKYISICMSKMQPSDNIPDVSAASTNKHLEEPFLRYPSPGLPKTRVKVTHRVLVQRQRYILGFTRLQKDLAESLEFLFRAWQRRLDIFDIGLDNLVGGCGAGICNRYGDSNGVVFGKHVTVGARCPVGECSVGEAVTEGEEWRNFGAFVVPVANVDALSVDGLQVLARPVVVRWIVFDPHWEGRW